MELKNFIKKYDPKDDGDWFEYQDGVKFLIAPMRNPEMKKKLLEEFTLAEAQQLEDGGATGLEGKGNVALGRVCRVYSRSLVFDWSGLMEGEKETKFNADKVHEWMMESTEFSNWVLERSNELLVKKYTKKEEVVKN
jgi:hypothetical protein